MAGSAHNLEPTMETPNESGLNEAIRLWRQELAGARTMHRSDLDELEAHLRDAIGELTQTGLSAEETFLVARRRLGPSSGLSAEFAKVNWQEVWLTRVLWMVGGVLAAPRNSEPSWFAAATPCSWRRSLSGPLSYAGCFADAPGPSLDRLNGRWREPGNWRGARRFSH
jgi:hypothetical protein